MTHDLLKIVPSDIPRPTKHGKTYYAKGDFLYFHYCCDNYNDVVSEHFVETLLSSRDSKKNSQFSKMNAFFGKKIFLVIFIDRKRDGVVHTVRCNQCVHGSQRIVIQ